MYIKKKNEKKKKKYNQTPFSKLFNTIDLTTQHINELVGARKIGLPVFLTWKFHVKHIRKTIIIPVKWKEK